ncbi:hypothetical protein DL96DRAFT_1607532 [Flagelloscypha sp. PMI_526]|nr:hypothetical protein DL96DRAFT_1607532 [Flagelloscypha sp. PMI_526]
MASERQCPRIPSELLERIISYVHFFRDLKACCLASRVFVQSAQAKLFRRVRLKTEMVAHRFGPTIPRDIMGNLASIISTPLITNVRTVEASYDHSFLPTFVDALPKAALEELTLNGDLLLRGPWSSNLLQGLGRNIFPFLTSLVLFSLDVPVSIVASCALLSHLERKMPEVAGLFDDTSVDLGLASFHERLLLPLKRLKFDFTKKLDETSSPFINFITGGQFPSLIYLDIGGRQDDYFPIEDLAIIMPPLMNQLCCLDLGFFNTREYGSAHLEHLHLRNYPSLRFLATQMGDDYSILSSLEDTRGQLTWFSQMFESLTVQHPLRIFAIRLSGYRVPQSTTNNFDGRDPLSREWERLDRALQPSNLPSLSKVAISLPSRKELIPSLEQNLPYLREEGKLTFQAVDIADFYWSLPKATRG